MDSWYPDRDLVYPGRPCIFPHPDVSGIQDTAMIDQTLVIVVLVGGTLGIIAGIMIVDAWLWGLME